MTRAIRADVATSVKTVVAPTVENTPKFMEVLKAIGSMPLAKLHVLYEELFGHKPMVKQEDGSEILSPNRKQMTTVCQLGWQAAFYGKDIPAQVKGITDVAFAADLVSESPKSRATVARGPTIKDLVLNLLVGTEGEYTDPADGQKKVGLIVPSDEVIYAAVKKDFPNSKFDRTHLAWYLTQYRKGTFEKAGFGGKTGKPMGVLQRNLDRAAGKAERAAEAAKKAEEKKAKQAGKQVEIVPPAGAIAVPAGATADPLADFGGAPEVADPANP